MNKLWAIHASKMAAAIGENPYVTPGQIAKEMWQNVHPESYQAAMARNGQDTAELERQSRIETSLKQNADLINAAISSDDHQVRDRKLAEIVIDESLSKETQQEIKSEIRGHVSKTRGTIRESQTIEKIEQDTNVKVQHVNDKYHKIRVPYGDKTYIIGGKTDGIVQQESGERILIEIKNRQRRIMSNVPAYEVVQCQTLMKLTGIQRCHLVQHFMTKTKTTEIVFDDDTWNTIQTKATEFIERLDALMVDEEAQDDLITLDVL